jgi:hypothetical protein
VTSSTCRAKDHSQRGVYGVLGLVVFGFGFEELDGEVLQFGWEEIHDARFDVVACVDEWESVGCAVGEVVGVARAGFVENVGDCGEELVFVGAANVLVGFDFSVKRVSLMLGPRRACWVCYVPHCGCFGLLL